MKKELVLSLFLGLFIIANPITGFSQANSVTEDQLITNADNLFGNDNYKSAMPLYAHLVSVHSDNATFNYRYGVCALYNKRDNKETPIKYLSVAESKTLDNPKLNYYLGLAYHNNQDYAKALKYYNSYLNNAPADSPEKEEVLKSINSCLNGLSLSGKKMIAEMLDKTSFEKDNFHRGYYADDLKGTLIVKPEIFKCKIDKKKEALTFVYLSEPKGICYFSSYGDDESENKDIYKSVLQEDDNWSEPEKISSVINTQYDEDYPVLTDNGTTLYFCSKGHNSLGGYDIFMSKYDKEKEAWTEPENLGVGVNSPFNDILFIPGKNGETAYFSSDRDNTENNITVYNIKISEGETARALALTDELPKEELQPTEKIETAEMQKPQLIAQNNVKQECSSDTKQVNTTSAPYLLKEKMLKERNEVRLITDSAFLFVANTKNDIRKLTNTRERAKRISDSKSKKAEVVHLSLDSLMESINNISDIEIVQGELEKAKNLKQEYCLLIAASTKAYEMAQELSAQIKAKEKELKNLKEFASQIQLKSGSGAIDSVNYLFDEVKVQMARTETHRDFSKDIMLITSGKMEYTIPEKEFAFADEYLKQREEGTFLASAGTKQEPNSTDLQYINKKSAAASVTVSTNDKKTFEPVIIKQINLNNLAYASVEPGYDDIEINFTADVTTIHQAEVIDTEIIAFNDITLDDNIEINFTTDVTTVHQAAAIDTEALAFTEPAIDDDIEIDFLSDAISQMPIEEIIVEKQALAENYSDMGAGADFNIDPVPATKDNGNTVRKNEGLTYFTNSIILPDEIETSKTDSKLLELAFNDPNELSYEELLYVAQLASSSSKSLEILDFAFVNENRDWRAYNNAAAYAIELKDYNRAKVYLKQALMITDDNGMIENNIGIIAYRTGNFESAEKHFVAANNLGENSKHNLMVLKYAINKTSQDTDNRIDTAVEPDELIGDIIDYFPTNE